MTIEKKLLGTSPSGGATDVADVFSIDLHTGNASTKTITNGIDLAGEGGLVWLKGRSAVHEHALLDTSRGDNSALSTQNTSAAANETGFGSFLSDGFSFASAGSWYNINQNNLTYVAWTFRKKKKFFDVVTYTGNGATSRNISHSLGVAPAMMIVKRYDGGSTNWFTYHSGTGNNKYLYLNDARASAVDTEPWAATTPTDSVFTVGSGNTNGNTNSFVAYLFADNSSEDAEEQMIKCGGYTGAGAHLNINLGWEPQFVLIKCTSHSANWVMFDNMRGLPVDGNAKDLRPNATDAEGDNSAIGITSTGFLARNGVDGQINANSRTYIWMAIRADLMVEPKAATDVFGMSNAMTQPLPAFNSTFPVDMSLNKRPAYGQNNAIGSRLQGTKHLYTDTAGAEVNEVEYVWDFMDGWGGFNSSNSDYQSWNWKRAKGFMDCVAYSGSGANRTLPHSLSVVPEMIWVKSRTTAEQWVVYHSSMALSVGTSPPRRIISYLNLNNRPALSTAWDNQDPTDSVFSIGTPSTVNQSNIPYIAYLFATLDGVSKCGGYTGNGSSQTIPCGFSAGSRFILIHRTDDPDDDGVSGNWYVWDSVRGIVAGNDPHLSLNTLSAQVTSDDSVDPHNSGFIVNQVSATNINVSSGKYIFYAIA